jgi:hypothetical protein
MRTLVTTRHFELRVHSARRLVVLYRSREPFASIAALDECFVALERGIIHVRRDSYGLLLDVRDGPVRNDPEFERVFRVHRQRFFHGFPRIAVVTATAIGGMQVARHARADNSGAQAFGSVEDALKYLGVSGTTI